MNPTNPNANPELTELVTLWEESMERPDTVTIEQIVLWLKKYPVDIIRHGITKAAVKNTKMGGLMDKNYRRNYASRMMRVASQELNPPAQSGSQGEHVL